MICYLRMLQLNEIFSQVSVHVGLYPFCLQPVACSQILVDFAELQN